MVDYSFLRFKSSFDEAKNIGDSPTATHIKHTIQLSPNEAYLQITNVDGGFAFGGNYNAYIVDCNDEVLKDITDHIFIDEFSYNSETQSKVEIINLNVDYYMKTVFIKIESTISNVVLWSNPVTISDYRLWETSYFQYKNYDNFENIGYTNAQCWQSIRLKCYFDIPVDESEIESYYQISRSRTISPRALIKRFSQYKIDFINSFTFIRLNTLLKHELIYINGVRITDKPVVEGQEREGDSNWFPSTFVCAKNENDTLEYEYQVFDGFELIDKVPEGVYTLSSLPTQIQGQFNSEITIGTGTLTIYDASDNSVVQSFTQDDLIEVNDFTFGINGLDTYVTSNGDYYILFESGLISSELFGIVYGGITEPTQWTFSVRDADFDGVHFNNNDFFTD